MFCHCFFELVRGSLQQEPFRPRCVTRGVFKSMAISERESSEPPRGSLRLFPCRSILRQLPLSPGHFLRVAWHGIRC